MKSKAVKAVERALARIDYSEYSKKVCESVAKKAAIHDRIRARSLASAYNLVMD